MTTIVLLIVAGIVCYYLYITLQNYLKNPITTQTQDAQVDYNLQSDPYTQQLSSADKLKNSYAGVSVRILNKLLEVSKDSHTSNPLQEILIQSFIKGICANTNPNKEQELKDMLGNKEDEEISKLAQIFLDNTYGEYKKRLSFIGFLLMIAWSDRDLNAKEQDVIFDVAAFLEIDNKDFNELYEGFEKHEPKLVGQYQDLLQKELESSEHTQITQEILQTQALRIIAKAQKAQESPSDTLDKLLDLQEAYQNLSESSQTPESHQAKDSSTTHTDSIISSKKDALESKESK